MACWVPPLYGVGAGVAMVRGYWPPPQMPPVGCPPPRPQRPPQQPPPNPPPPPQVYVETRYYLSFPPFIGVNVKIFHVPRNKYIFPSSEPIVLSWRYYPALDARPEIAATTPNSLIYTMLRPFIDERGQVFIILDPGIPRPPHPLIVIQFLYDNRRWIAVAHEVYFPPVPDPGRATPNNYRLALQNRKEKLVAFYDSAIEGLGSFTCSDLTIHLTPDSAIIPYFIYPQPEYYIQPTSSPAYCMFIAPWR